MSSDVYYILCNLAAGLFDYIPGKVYYIFAYLKTLKKGVNKFISLRKYLIQTLFCIITSKNLKLDNITLD
jgi:hypothetical protein